MNNNDGGFDIKKLPRIEIYKPMDKMMKYLFVIFVVAFPGLMLGKFVSDNILNVGHAAIAALVYYAVVAFFYFGVKYYYVLDGKRKILLREANVMGHISHKYICPFDQIACVAIDSMERQTKTGATGQYWYETFLVCKDQKIVKLHRTFEDSYDEIQDAEQYAEYLGCKLFGPKPGKTFSIKKDDTGQIYIEFSR